MRFDLITRENAHELVDRDMIVTYEAGGETYLLGTFAVADSMSLGEALRMIHWTDEKMDEAVAAIGWDGWDYDCIQWTYSPGAYLAERGLIPAYILRDLDGYGNASPVCVSREEADRLMRGWYAGTEAPTFDEVWREADRFDVEQYGFDE